MQASQAAGPSSNPAQNANLSVRDVQVKLNQLGYNVGAPDGQLGRATVAGIRAFQRDRRLTISGQLTNHHERAGEVNLVTPEKARNAGLLFFDCSDAATIRPPPDVA